ncbi:Twin-arginine translocation pathway signal [Streptomyces xiamenensis]|uniref:Twin-arginine translocation pathway signal n=1 Tax=Streptomyces xiamenensis TaxID=408015 RepID=UPI0035DE58C2
MAAVITRSRRAAIVREAARIRRDAQRHGHTTRQIAHRLRQQLPEVRALEAWRLALGWSRADAIDQIARCYLDQGLQPPGPSESMLCRWEHGQDRPGPEYTVMLARAYGTTPETLELARPDPNTTTMVPALRYGQPHRPPPPTWREPMTTAAGLPAVRESLHLALLADPTAGPEVLEAAHAAVEHYALNYSRHPPHALFAEVRGTRELLTAPLAAGPRDTPELARLMGWLSALLGNLAHHLGDDTGAGVHLTTAAHIGHRTGDTRLTAWSFGARSMTARARGQADAATEYAERGLAAAPTPLIRAQLLGWALLPSLAAQGRAREVEETARAADEAFAAATEEPGRFGYDHAEHRLHQATAHLDIGRHDDALRLAETSAAAKTTGTPGWAAATILHARAEAAAGHHSDAAERALDVLARVPAAHLRSNTRTRLNALNNDLTGIQTTTARDLHEQHRALVPLIDPHGRAGG